MKKDAFEIQNRSKVDLNYASYNNYGTVVLFKKDLVRKADFYFCVNHTQYFNFIHI